MSRRYSVEAFERDAPGLREHLKTFTSKTETGETYHPYENIDAELEELTVPRWRTPTPSTARRASGAVRFDSVSAIKFLRFCRMVPHVKGRQFAGKPFVPDLWQVVFIVAPLFGWRRADGTRLARVLYLEVARKNGKSTLCAAIVLFLLCADDEPGAEVISAARDRDQARAVFSVAARMVLGSAKLRKRLHLADREGRIDYKTNGSEYRIVSSDKGGLAKHGMNVHGAVIDELHVLTDRDLVQAIETGTGSRLQPLICYITTAGIPSESPVWLDKRNAVITVAEARAEDEELLGVIFAASADVVADGSWREEAVWREANPGLGKSVQTSYLARAARTAEISPAELAGFLRLHLDVPTESVTGWIPMPIYDRSASIVDPADLVGARCYGGLDLASSLDLAALVLVFPDDDDQTLDVLAKFWTPADTLRARAHADKADYERWAREGFLTATPGETIDDDVIEVDLIEARDTYELVSLGYDPWGSKQLVRHLEAADVPLFAVRQGFASMSPPTKDTARLIYDQRLRTGGNPVLRYCVGNTKVAGDPAGNIKPDKKRSTGRIDGTVALVMAVNEWLRDIAKGRSAYEDRDLEVG